MKITKTLGDFTVVLEGTPEELAEYERITERDVTPVITWKEPFSGGEETAAAPKVYVSNAKSSAMF